MVKLLLTSCAAVLCSLPLVFTDLPAQTARQGDPNAARTATEYHSPMILDTVFPATDSSLWGKGEWFTVDEYHELGRFTCDGVSLKSHYLPSDEHWDST